MKRFVVLALLAVIVLSSCSLSGDKVVAVVGGKKISPQELYRYIPPNQFNDLSPDDKKAQVEKVVDDYLAYLYLDENGVWENEDVSWENRVWEIRELANGAFQSLIINKIMTKDVLLKEYEKRKKELNVSHILIAYNTASRKLNDRSKEEALELVSALEDSVTADNFTKIAMKYSDDASKEENAGNLGWGGSGYWVEPFENAAYKLKPGEISEPVETGFGYHIIKLNEQREVNVDPFEYVEPEIRDVLFNRWRIKFARREDIVYDSLRATNNLVYDDEAIADFSERFVRLSKNVFYSDQFSAFDILDVFEDTLVLAHLGDRPVDKAWLYKFLKLNSLQRPGRFLSEENVRGFIEKNMMGDWLYQAALGLGLDKTKDFLDTKSVFLAQKSMPLFDKLYVYEQINPSKQELRDFYEENKEDLYLLEPRVSVKEVLLEDSLFAVEILNRARSGESMSSLAEEYSIRNYGKKNKGLIPAVKKNQYGEMSLAAFNMKDGEIDGPFKVGEYYSVIQRIEYIPGKSRPYDDVSYRILIDYRNKFAPDKKEEQMTMLRNKYSVRINPSFLE
jgi:parvulin-like peptidyl-prolyl isomerase